MHRAKNKLLQLLFTNCTVTEIVISVHMIPMEISYNVVRND